MDAIAEIGRAWLRHDWMHASAMLGQISVLRTHQLFMSKLEDALQPYSLSLPRFEVMAILYFSQHGRLPLGKIGERLQVHPTSISSLVDGLQVQGYVIRAADPHDRRTRLATLTDSGREVVLRAKDAVSNCYADFGLTDEEVYQLVGLLNKVRVFCGDEVDEPSIKAVLEGEPVAARLA